MALETATYINQLVATNPLGSDPIASGDDHIRLIKAALQATFPNITGPVTPTQAVLNNPFPVGGIILWSGAISAVPAGWALCDGTLGTPNLRDRFVVGAGTAYAVGATGGSDSVTLDATQIPGHTHSVSIVSDSQGAHTHSISDPGHSHGYSAPTYFTAGQGGGGTSSAALFNNPPPTYQTSSVGTGISVQSAGAHTHTISGTSASTGGGLAHENRPPYYALAYIMKV